MTEKIIIDTIELYHGDCLDVLPSLSGVDAVISDPPYGMNNDADYSRFSGGNTRRGPGIKHESIIGDREDFDPSPWLSFERVVLWGANHFWNRLPKGAALIWQKRNDNALGTFLSDGEVAFMNVGHGVYVFTKTFAGSTKAVEAGIDPYAPALHPNQKPIQLMSWCIERAKVPEGGTVLDPYMGSGTTGIACIKTGRRFIGIEKDRKHFENAKKRIERELAQVRMFVG